MAHLTLTHPRVQTSKISKKSKASKSKSSTNANAEILVSAKSYTDSVRTNEEAAATSRDGIGGSAKSKKPATPTTDTGPTSTAADFDETRNSLSIMEDESFVKEMSEEEHMEMLRAQREQCLTDGYMLPKPDFDHLHYEDPRVTELKRTDVSHVSVHWTMRI